MRIKREDPKNCSIKLNVIRKTVIGSNGSDVTFDGAVHLLLQCLSTNDL